MADEVAIRLSMKNKRRFSADAKGAAKDIRGIDKSADRAARSARSLTAASRGVSNASRAVGRWAGYAGAALVGGAAYGAKESYEAFNESRKVQRDQAAALKSTGAEAWTSGRQLERHTQQLMRLTGVDDEAIAKSKTLLLTFRQVRNEVGAGNDIFDQASQTALDLSARFDKDLGSSSVMLGKALENPVKGVTALTRVGVTFSAEQKRQIEQLVEQNDLLGAQKIVLSEVQKQTKGAAAAQRTNADVYTTSLGNVQEALGAIEAPVLDAAFAEATQHLDRLEPRLNRIAQRTEGIFNRDDLTFGQKLDRTGNVAGRQLAPVIRQLERELGRIDAGKAVADAIERGAPVMADALAGQVPRMMSAFGSAFMNAGPGGQLLTAALITAKLGGFSAAGRWAAGQFAADFATASASPTARGKFRGVGKMAGKWIGRGIGAGLLLGIAEYGDDIADWLEDNVPGYAASMKVLGDQLGVRANEEMADWYEEAGIDPTRIGPNWDPGNVNPNRQPIGGPQRPHPGLTRRPRVPKTPRRSDPRSRTGPRGFSAAAPFPNIVAEGSFVAPINLDGERVGEGLAKVTVRRRDRG